MILENTNNSIVISEQWAQKFFLKLCAQLQHGELILQVGDEIYNLGQAADDGFKVRVNVTHRKTFWMLMTMGSNGAAEAYMNGFWETDNLTGLIQLILRNQKQMDAMESGFASVAAFIAKIWHYFNRNTKSGSKKNIAAHYDLGNDFFKLFLDQNLMYSSAIYPTEKEDLETASQIKLRTICEKLELQPGDHLLEIGSGWGGMAVYAAQHYGCEVTTTTISKEQFDATVARVKANRLEHKITVLQKDYRDLTGKFDKLVSIEMVEAVGHQFLENYFQQIQQRLKPNGLAVIQAITIEDSRYEQALKTVDFIKRYIFPGSFIPCVSVLTKTAAASNLRLFNLEDIGPSYALTLRHWSARFHAQLPAVKQQGFDDRFIRMWDFYLSYCEGGFLERSISVVQMTLVQPNNRCRQWLKLS